MWRAVRTVARRTGGAGSVRRLSDNSSSSYASVGRRREPEDEGDWSYSSEWWGSDSGAGDDVNTVFRSTSDHGNGVVSVLAYPSSRPSPDRWAAKEAWLQQRYAKINPNVKHDARFKILGYQWRVLRFNDNTRQSIVKVMAGYRKSGHESLFLVQQPHCLAVPYLKSMVSAGLTALASSSYDLSKAVVGKKDLKVLCVGHGGGSLPLFIASKIKGATVHVVEIDPVVISASIQAMGFPCSTVKETSPHLSFPCSAELDNLLWECIHERIILYRSDAEDFVLDSHNVYDLVFIDAYDGDDIFPRKLWDPEGPFLKSIQNRVHPVHGTVVLNLHSDSEVLTSEMSNYSDHESILPMGKHILRVCRAYKEHFDLTFCVSVPWLCNSTLVACRGLGSGTSSINLDRVSVLNFLMSKSNLVEFVMGFPFPCLQYIKNGFVLI